VLSRLNLSWEGREPSASDLPMLKNRSSSACQTLGNLVVGYYAVLVMVLILVGVLSPTAKIGVKSEDQALLDRLQDEEGFAEWVFILVGVGLIWKVSSVKKGLTIVIALVSLFWLLKIAARLDVVFISESVESEQFQSYIFIRYVQDVVENIFWALNVMIIRNARRYVRVRYAIPPAFFVPASSQDPSGDDCLVALCWGPVAASQMLRHTMDYTKYGDDLFSSRGVQRGTPGIL
jgi:hypothetical protein